MRAFSIQIRLVPAGTSFVQPDNSVDIYLARTGYPTVVFLRHIKIAAVDHQPDKKVSRITVLVTPDQAAKLDLGQNKGVLQLVPPSM
jgi:Flp pilus assembly protein CpaB